MIKTTLQTVFLAAMTAVWTHLASSAEPAPAGAEVRRISLGGEWKFAADYQNWGDSREWFSPKYGDGSWDLLKVPGTWAHDPRFVGFIGAGWYRHRFVAPLVAPGEHVRLSFGAVFAKARVWLNGKFVGEHDGAYTPFELDVSGTLQPGASNVLVVCADNRWTRSGNGNQPQQQVVAWWDDGGIIRGVDLLIGPAVYVLQHKVEATPDLAAGTAVVYSKIWIRNTSLREERVTASAEIAREDEWLQLSEASVTAVVPAGATVAVELRHALTRQQVSLWQLDRPVLYRWRTTIGGHARETVRFGIRRFEIQGTGFLLNGHPIKLAGGNRHASYPGGGQDEPSEIVTRDLQLMKEGGFVFQRLSHYPVATAVLDWADRHGMLLIGEASHAAVGSADLMDDPQARQRFMREHRELIERDWNRPSIIAWSVGNEYASDTPAGLRWTKDMRDFTRQLDPSRLVTFVSNSAAKPGLKGGDEGSAYVDFVCLNTYGATPQKNAENIDITHQRNPNKPLIVTEYGFRHDFAEDETVRIDWFREMLALVRARPFVSGLSIWSFNDYRSRYVGTSRNGWREWGIIDPDRNPRGTYHALRREHTGLTVREAVLRSGVLTVRLDARTDFPVFPPADLELRVEFVDAQNRLLGEARLPLRAGAATTVAAPSGAGGYRAEVWRGGFRTGSFSHWRPEL